MIVTVAHLDHCPENVDPSNLRAWCQRCHNTYDAPNRARGIKERRRAALARVYASRDEMMVVVGEIKEIVPAHGAEKIVLRHVGDMPFVMDQDMARRFH